MTNVGRNKKCPCGSGEKYKRCYLQERKGCKLYLIDMRKKMIEEHDKREKLIMRFFQEVSEESNTVIVKSPDGYDLISMRVQMIITFSLVDVLASYWYEYQGETGRTNERAQRWYDTYCATERNRYYKDLWRDLTSERLYTFRNALVHFFGLGVQDESLYLSICHNHTPEDKRKKWEDGFLEGGQKTFIIKPREFSNLVREGAILMLDDWKNVITDAQTNKDKERNHIEGIKRVWNKVQKEGALQVGEGTVD